MKCPHCDRETLLILVHEGNNWWYKEYYCKVHGLVKKELER